MAWPREAWRGGQQAGVAPRPARDVDSCVGRNGPDADARKGHVEADKRALATLAARGIDSKERTRLRELVKTAQSAPSATSVETLSAQEAALRALKMWHEDWAETARAVIKKRADLIRLGLAKRQARKTEDEKEETEPTKPVTPSPSPVTPMPPRMTECTPPSPAPGGGVVPPTPVTN